MILIGLTGSVGTGKTETSKMFLRNKIPVFESDKQVAFILKMEKVLDSIKKNFPDALDGKQLIKKKLADIVFNDTKKLNTLEDIIYKRLKIIQAKWIRTQVMRRKKIVVFDVPLLFEKDNILKYDAIMVTTCSYSTQRKRVLKRREWSNDRFQLTLKKQLSENIKKKKANILVYTDRGKRVTLLKAMKALKLITYKKRKISVILRVF